VNANGPSVAASVSFTTGAVPGTPLTLARKTQSVNTIDLEWSAPTSNGGHPITGYKLEQQKPDNSWSVVY